MVCSSPSLSETHFTTDVLVIADENGKDGVLTSPEEVPAVASIYNYYERLLMISFNALDASDSVELDDDDSEHSEGED
jgi:hypothetical protein